MSGASGPGWAVTSRRLPGVGYQAAVARIGAVAASFRALWAAWPVPG